MNCDEKLKELAPVFLQHMHGDPAATCMAWGCECGDGWEQPVTDMCRRLEELNRTNDGLHVVADQIKSKFADLTVYWHIDDTGNHDKEAVEAFDRAASAVIDAAGDTCSRTCEKCGAPATTMTRGWLVHVCDACLEKWKHSHAWQYKNE